MAGGRTPPPVRSKGVGGARARQASPRVLAIVGGVVLVAIVAIVLGVVLSGKSNGGGGGGGGSVVSASDMSGLPKVGNAKWAGRLDGASDANNLFKGIPQQGLVLGNPSAPVEMEMFIDVQCPFCQDYEVNNLPTVVRDNIKSGKVQLHLQPWAFIGGQGSQSFSGRLGLIAASFQNKGFEYAKVLYDNQQQEDTGWLTGRQMALIAASVNGLNLREWQKAANGSAVNTIASKVDELAKKANVQGTPTVLVGCTGGQLQSVSSPSAEPNLSQTQNAIAAASCSK